MADTALPDLSELTTPADGDLLYAVDVSDTTDSAGGTNKKITKGNLLTNTLDVVFDTAPSGNSVAEGAVHWDATSHTLAVHPDEADSTMQVGQENWVRVYNNSGGTISNGEVVYASGKEDVEDRLTIAKARADADNTSKVIGFATHDIETATFGYVTQFGYVNGVDTSAFTDGASVWLSPTTAGAITDTAPESPDNIVFLGYIVDSAVSGNIFITTLGNTSGSGVLISDATEIVQNARKGSAGTINKGQPVYISGYNTGQSVIEIELADSDNANAMPAVGIANDSITNSTTGQVVLSGRVANIDTSTYSLGDSLYVDTTAGALTATRPTGATVQVQKVATVARVNASNGVIIVVGAGRTNDQPNYHTDDVFRIADNADTTKLINFQASGITTGTTRTITMPDADIDLTNVPSSAEKTVLGNTSGTNTGDQTSVSGTSGNTDALNSATTVVDVSAATAPTTGQVLTATGATAATWQTPAGGGGQTLYDAVLATSGGDYTDLSTAMAALTAGQTLFVRSGTYTETASFNETTENLTFIGENRETSILELSDSGGGTSTWSGAGMVFKNLTLQISDACRLDIGGADAVIENCNIILGASAPFSAFTFDGANSKFVHNLCVGNNSAAYRTWTFGSTEQIVQGNVFDIANGSGNANLGVVYVQNSLCVFDSNAISVATSSTANAPIYEGRNITNCTIRGSSSNSRGIYASSAGCIIANNRITSCKVGIYAPANDMVITGNYIETTAGSTSNAIDVISRCVITGNYLKGHASATGIDLSSNGDNNVISGNVFFTWSVGVSVPAAGNDQNLIVGNSFSTVTTDISDSGSNTLYLAATDSDPLNTT
jgi:hypothetical protein